MDNTPNKEDLETHFSQESWGPRKTRVAAIRMGDFSVLTIELPDGSGFYTMVRDTRKPGVTVNNPTATLELAQEMHVKHRKICLTLAKRRN